MKNITIVYHFFADYRQAIIDNLISSEDAYFMLGAPESLTDGLNVANIPKSHFLPCSSYVLAKGVLFQPKLIWYALKTKSDVLIFLGDSKFITTWLAAAIARVRGKRILFWTHGWVKMPRGLTGFIRKRFYKLAHGLLLYGERARAIGFKSGFPPKDLYVVNNSLDYSILRASANKLSPDQILKEKNKLFPDEVEHVLFCSGRLTPVKCLDLVIRAAYELRAGDVSVGVLLVGDGPERSSLESLASELCVPVYFTGKCFDPVQVALYTSMASLTVCPEAAGLTVMQSMSLGTPVVTSNSNDSQMPESEAVIHGKTGGIYKSGSVEDLTDVIRDLLLLSRVERSMMKTVCAKLMDVLYSANYQSKVISLAVKGEVSSPENVEDVVESLWRIQ